MCCYSDKGQIDSPLKANNSLRKCTVKHGFLVKKINKNTFDAYWNEKKPERSAVLWIAEHTLHLKIIYALLKPFMARLKLFLFFVGGKMILNILSLLFTARFFPLFWKTNVFPWGVQHQTALAASNIFCSCWEQGSSVVWLRSDLCITEVRDHMSGENVTQESTNKDKGKKYGNGFPCAGNELMVTKGQLHSWSKASSKSKWHSTVYCYRLTARAKRATQ